MLTVRLSSFTVRKKQLLGSQRSPQGTRVGQWVIKSPWVAFSLRKKKKIVDFVIETVKLAKEA